MHVYNIIRDINLFFLEICFPLNDEIINGPFEENERRSAFESIFSLSHTVNRLKRSLYPRAKSREKAEPKPDKNCYKLFFSVPCCLRAPCFPRRGLITRNYPQLLIAWHKICRNGGIICRLILD